MISRICEPAKCEAATARDDPLYRSLSARNYRFFPTRFIYRFWMILTLNRDCVLKDVKRFSLVMEVESYVRQEIFNFSPCVSLTLLFIYQNMHKFLKYNVKPQLVKTLKLH